jgi:hypothetical protein
MKHTTRIELLVCAYARLPLPLRVHSRHILLVGPSLQTNLSCSSSYVGAVNDDDFLDAGSVSDGASTRDIPFVMMCTKLGLQVKRTLSCV